MSKKLLLVDFENVQAIGDLSLIHNSFHIIVFIGANQKKVTTELLVKTQKLGARLEWKQVEGHGKNALDFYISFQLGKALEKEPNRECVIFSKDKGFDTLLAGLTKDGRNCRRIESLEDLK